MSERDFYNCGLSQLAEEAEQLQTRMNEFIGRCEIADVRLPAPLYDANAALLGLPGTLRQASQLASARRGD